MKYEHSNFPLYFIHSCTVLEHSASLLIL